MMSPVSRRAGRRASALSRVLEWPIAIAKKLARVIAGAVQRFYSDQCPQQAAAIAYRVLFSIAPLAIVLVSIFGLLLEDDDVRDDVVSAIVDALPVSAAGKKDVEEAITAIAVPASAAGLASLLVSAWAATGMMTAVRRGLESAMSVTESRPMARGKLVDLLLILGAALLVLVMVGITVLGNLVQRASGSLGEIGGPEGATLAGGLMRATKHNRRALRRFTFRARVTVLVRPPCHGAGSSPKGQARFASLAQWRVPAGMSVALLVLRRALRASSRGGRACALLATWGNSRGWRAHSRS